MYTYISRYISMYVYILFISICKNPFSRVICKSKLSQEDALLSFLGTTIPYICIYIYIHMYIHREMDRKIYRYMYIYIYVYVHVCMCISYSHILSHKTLPGRATELIRRYHSYMYICVYIYILYTYK